MEDVDDVAVSSWRLFDLTGQGQAGHSHDVKGQSDQRLCVVKPLEQHAPGGHGDLNHERRNMFLLSDNIQS